MNISGPFIRRPVMTTMLMTALIIFGIAAYGTLPVSELPNVDFPTVSVTANLPGADPQTMAAAVATPLERQFSAIPGVSSMDSVSSTGSTRITLQFDLDRDIDAAAQDVQTAISQSIRRLPDNMPAPPSLRKVNPADFAIIYLALSAKQLPLTQLDEYAETRVAQQISTIPGVAQVLVFGSHKYAVRLQMNPYALAARNLSLSQVEAAIRAGNSNLPTGVLSGSTQSYTVQAEGQLQDAAAYKRLVIAYRNGAPVHLGDVGEARDSIEQDKQLTTFFDNTSEDKGLRPAIVLAVKRQPGANTVEVSRAVRDRLAALTMQAPGDATLRVLHDRADYINGSIHEVKFTLIVAIVLVVGVIFLFLRNPRATLISAMALPTSLIGTFALMKVFGFSLDNLSLMGITLAVAFVVDDAIVVLENIVRYREKGEKPMQAALIGTREIGFTVVSMTLSLVAVFIPIMFMGGLVGRLFNEFGLTVTIAILISGLVSLTFTPMLSSRFLPENERHTRLYYVLERAFDRIRDAYGRTLAWSVDHWPTMLAAGAMILVLTFYLFSVIPKGFIPSEDTGMIVASTKAPEGVTFDQLRKLQDRVATLVMQNPNVAAAMSSAGQGGGGVAGGNIGRMFIRLNPQEERRVSADEVLQQLRKAVAPVHEMQVFFQNPPAIRIGSLGGSGQYQYVLQGTDLDELDKAATEFEPLLGAVPGVQDVSSSLELSNPQINVTIQRDVASALGVSAEQIQSTLYSAYGGGQVSTIYGASDEYQVIMELAPKYQTSIDALNALYVPAADGRQVPLRAVADIAPGVGPLSVSHYGQLPSVSFSFNLAPGTSLGEITRQIDDLARNGLPAEITSGFTGSAETFRESLVGMPLLMAITVLVIYMVLAVLYEHFIHPITILTALPLAMLGALLTLIFFGEELNLFSFVGLILLVGLVKKNGIIMVDFAVQIRREQRASARDAIIQACLVRFRPIMMTTLAAVFGTLPIALSSGLGSESRRPLGIAVVGGLLFSQMLTLYITPAFYVAMEHLTDRLRRRHSAAATAGKT
ncbi:MAG: MMPL family transporter [Gammaproteobacteria bacterium]|nr:MMPL family transporter [Gammaproteobacteria bacterium]